MSDEEYRQEGINMQLKPIKDKIKALEEWKKTEEEQHQNITKALDNFVIDAGAIGDNVYSNKLKALEKKLDEEIKSRENWELAYVKAGEEIKNLEEQIRGMDRTIGSVVNHLIARLDNQEKVLRELHELMRGLVSDLQDSNSLSKATIKCYEGKLVKNLEKLDSKKIYKDPWKKHMIDIYPKDSEGTKDASEKLDSKPKQAEKKELCKECLYGDNFPLNKNICPICIPNSNKSKFKEKDSEGVDVVESSKHTCSFCGRKLILYGQEWICGHGCTKPAIRPDEKLPEFVCSLELQGECGNEGSMDCLKGNSKGERFDNNVCVHGKKELENHPEPQCEICGEKVPKDGDGFCSSECFEEAQWDKPKTEPVDPCISCNEKDICVNECEISKEAKGRKETFDAKQVERFLNDMGCNVGITRVKWGPNLIKDLEGEEDFDSRDYRLIKRRDLEELIEIGDNEGEKPKVVEFLERIKEVYGIK
jgi:TolA-binding protein